MEFLMLLPNVIICLQLNFALYNTMNHDDFIPKTNICSQRSLVLSGPSPVQFEQEIGFVDQEDFGFDLVEQVRDGK